MLPHIAGIIVRTGPLRDIAEEATFAYKDINLVVDIAHLAGLALKVAMLGPMTVIGG